MAKVVLTTILLVLMAVDISAYSFPRNMWHPKFLLPSRGLSTSYYARSCESFADIVKKNIIAAMQKDPSTSPGLLRLAFHDCWVRGCDASVLVNGNNTERTAGPNLSLEGLDLIESIKAELEVKCKGVVSCADILQVAARDAVVLAGGDDFHYDVPCGRKDGRISKAAEVVLPSPFSSANDLLAQFAEKQLTATDLVALSGAHSHGDAHCSIIRNRLVNNDSTLNATYADQLRNACKSPSTLVELDPVTPKRMDNQYYRNLQVRKGLFTSDEDLFFNPATSGLVNKFAASNTVFARQFAASMVKLITLPPFQSTKGSIRSKCSIIN